MSLNLHVKLTALLLVYSLLVTLSLLTPTSETKEVERYIVCPDGTDQCVPYSPHEVKVIYK